MKKIIVLSLISGLLIVFSCQKTEQGHKMRVTNNYPFVATVVVENKPYPRVAPGATTDYQSLNEGYHSVDISTPTSLGIITETKTISIWGDGEHSWTLKLVRNANLAYSFEIYED